MKKAAVVVALLSASLLLAGCSSEPAAPAPLALAKSTVDSNSAPAFLSTPQTAADQIGSVAGVQSDSTRYQGTVHGTKIYLGLDLGNHVEIIHPLGGGWAQGGSGGGNVVFESGLPDGDAVQYVPQGATSKTLAGWVPLSKYIIAKKN
jgi:hypothetical protein